MGRRHHRKHARRERLPTFALAFGLGLTLAVFCSVKLALLIAAIILIYVGTTIYL